MRNLIILNKDLQKLYGSSTKLGIWNAKRSYKFAKDFNTLESDKGLAYKVTAIKSIFQAFENVKEDIDKYIMNPLNEIFKVIK